MMEKQNFFFPLGVIGLDQKVILFSRLAQKNSFEIQVSLNGHRFHRQKVKGVIRDKEDKPENITLCRDFFLSHYQSLFFLTYRKKKKKGWVLAHAVSENLSFWRKLGETSQIKSPGMIVSDYDYRNQPVLFFGKKSLRQAYCLSWHSWQVLPQAVYLPQAIRSQGGFLRLADVEKTPRGILVLYFLAGPQKKSRPYALKAVFFSLDHPGRLLPEFRETIWEGPLPQLGLEPVGVAKKEKKLISYWLSNKGKLKAFVHSGLEDLWRPVSARSFFPFFNRFQKNPLLKPIKTRFWESVAVFNTAAVKIDDRVHFVYRAVGDNYVSMMGYAASPDGLKISKRLASPVYTPRQSFETNQPPGLKNSSFVSGPGCGGCEDPRMTRIDGRLYLTYNAWNGYDPPKVALTSISEEDFLSRRWRWRPSVLISSPDPDKVKNPDGINKNWVIFPEKIKGRYAILHSLSPMQIDYFDSLDFDGRTFIDSYREWKENEEGWDLFIRGVGPPPLKTPRGWLLFYHAASRRHGYNIGAMLLDSADPNRILSRARQPVLKPESWYETQGLKPNIVYSCGAVIFKKILYLYYGGSDEFVCAAYAPLKEFINKLVKTGKARLQPSGQKIKLREV